MTSLSESPDHPGTCLTCGQTFGWHEENRPRHPFNPDGLGSSKIWMKSRPERPTGDNGHGAQITPRAAAYPIDPVLRVALINAGVITPDDLKRAEELIQATTAQFQATVEGSRNGQ